jgi:hypothetical protein
MRDLIGSFIRLVLRTVTALSHIIRVINSRRIRQAGHISRAGEMRNTYKFSIGNLDGRDCLEDLEVALKRYLNTHPFYCVEEFLTFIKMTHNV